MSDARLDDPHGMQHSRDHRHDPQTRVTAHRSLFFGLHLLVLTCAATGSAGAFFRAPYGPAVPADVSERPVFEVSRSGSGSGSVDVEEGTLFVN